jgi:hypothetical protein
MAQSCKLVDSITTKKTQIIYYSCSLVMDFLYMVGCQKYFFWYDKKIQCKFKL